MNKWFILLAVVFALGIGASKVMAGSVNVDLDSTCDDSNRNTNPISNDADPVTIWITSTDKHFVTNYLVTVTDTKKNFLGSACSTFQQCPSPDSQWYHAEFSFNSLLSTDPVGNVQVTVTESPEGCVEGGKKVGGQTLLLTD